ncbi:TrmH family RNA methyltransferase [Sunxiuqinia sp. A32]|uniref:TrmH family RNA methyltransferase n=1 Tax=Sunxiuqinia sp. A32 TaxID=3461496 RepID=UPI0040464FA1
METNSVSFFQSEDYPDLPEKPLVAAWKTNNPGNIGSLMRIADNVGASQVFILDEENPKRESAIKKTAGLSYKNIEVIFCSFDEFIKNLAPEFQLVAIETSTGSKNIYQTKLPQKIAFLLGSEKFGLPVEILEKCSLSVHIPMTGKCKSMNISHALAVSLFEWQRQQLFL